MRKDGGSLALSWITRYMSGCPDSPLHLTLGDPFRQRNRSIVDARPRARFSSKSGARSDGLAGLRSYGCGRMKQVGSGFDVFGLLWLSERSTRCSRYVISCLPSPEAGE